VAPRALSCSPPPKHTYRHVGLDDARPLGFRRILPERQGDDLQFARAVAAAQLGWRRARLAGLALCISMRFSCWV
jgi:hypothetical protein